MTGFDQLHPALQHHIVNSLGWRELRPFQEEVTDPLLAGRHAVILAPTAGGKTEAAFFPLASRMLAEDWQGLSLLYICPIRALLNSLETRLQRYCSLLGRRVALWHGDVKPGARRAILREPPDCLLTTPESLELMLVSERIDPAALFARLQAVIIDELHAFAGDDRGWHLLSVLERITALAGRELQRVGLSATVGNPEQLLDWLAGSCNGERFVYRPPDQEQAPADVKLDHVGTIANAALVISRLHRGEKRLVFTDSRARAEQLGAELRKLGVETFVTHSSLSHQQRREAEAAFASRSNCVIVATSVLELGIDVGDLDRVIQIDAPATVSSFLQRMGRTGRRPGTQRNCLFLATSEDAVLRAAALIELFQQGYVEPIEPPAEPWHILAQQIMALTLQAGGLGRSRWRHWIGRMPGFAAMPSQRIDELIDWMGEKQILFEEAGILSMGREGERAYGHRHYMDLLSVFTAPPLFTVLYGRQELGFVDELSFLTKRDEPTVLLLGGRPWRITHIDWPRRIAHVEAADADGRSRWSGRGQELSFRLAQAIKRILMDEGHAPNWSRRATQAIDEIRAGFSWLAPHSTAAVMDSDERATWWTFAGSRANAALATAITGMGVEQVSHDSLSVTMRCTSAQELTSVLEAVRNLEPTQLRPVVDERAVEGLKFSECLPEAVALQVVEERLADVDAVARVVTEPVRAVR